MRTLVTTASPNVTLCTAPPTLCDMAVLSGGYSETGVLVFTLSGPAGFSYTQNVAVNGNGIYRVSKTLPTCGTVAGTYTWSAHYCGDSNNSSANDQGGCAEQTVVCKASPTVVTAANPTATIFVGTTAPTLCDSAVLSGGYYETGTLTFTLHQGGFCGPAVYCTVVTVNGNGTYSAGTASETCTGLYSWTVAYSGNANNNAACGQLNCAEQVTLQDQVARNGAATMGFWANSRGQALLKTYGTPLGKWLSSTYPNLFGNLGSATGSQVAAYFLLVKNKSGSLVGNTYAQALTGHSTSGARRRDSVGTKRRQAQRTTDSCRASAAWGSAACTTTWATTVPPLESPITRWCRSMPSCPTSTQRQTESAAPSTQSRRSCLSTQTRTQR
jgi:hypothetical protein